MCKFQIIAVQNAGLDVVGVSPGPIDRTESNPKASCLY